MEALQPGLLSVFRDVLVWQLFRVPCKKSPWQQVQLLPVFSSAWCRGTAWAGRQSSDS